MTNEKGGSMSLSELKYNETKSLLNEGLFNREEVAKRARVSHTLVSRVNNTKDYQEYALKYIPNSQRPKRSLWRKIKEFFS